MCVCIAVHTYILKPKSNFYPLFPSFIMAITPTSPRTHTTRAQVITTAHTQAREIAQGYSLPYCLAFSIAQQQAEWYDFSKRGNKYMVAHITYYAEKYKHDITRLCHIIRPTSKGGLLVQDLERGETRTPRITNIKRIKLVSTEKIATLAQQNNYITRLMFGLQNN